MNITNVQYIADLNGENVLIKATINGMESIVPLDPANKDYTEIVQQVEVGTLTIAPADEDAADEADEE